MSDRELLKMALHALKFSQNMKRCFARAEQDYHEKIAPITINALEAALAQPDEIKSAVLAEREACAKAVYDSTDWAHEEQDMTLKETIAAAIRARGDKHE